MFNQTIRDFCQSQQDNETLALSIKFNSLSLSFIKYAIMHGIWHLTAINLCENSTNNKVTSSHKSLNLIMSVRNRYNQVQIYMQFTVEISGPNVSALSRRLTALFSVRVRFFSSTTHRLPYTTPQLYGCDNRRDGD